MTNDVVTARPDLIPLLLGFALPLSADRSSQSKMGESRITRVLQETTDDE